ncbi:hypothetical protein [Phenylobacterium sp.]|uniref:hypothetical protein n=1 Tax=Phenylobacterium sp. TaxID=1871053 RepID=UPI0025FA5102|nr:hypothetical protein [Phenylobacterium sp.]
MSLEITQRDLTEWGSAGLVFVSGAMTGHYAAAGMDATQWLGAAIAVLGSVAVAVAVRVWRPKGAAVKAGD